jgi:hypothetical protein
VVLASLLASCQSPEVSTKSTETIVPPDSQIANAKSSQPSNLQTQTACELATQDFKLQDAANWEFVKVLEKLTPEEKSRIDRQSLKSTIDSRIAGLEMARAKMKYDCAR